MFCKKGEINSNVPNPATCQKPCRVKIFLQEFYPRSYFEDPRDRGRGCILDDPPPGVGVL